MYLVLQQGGMIDIYKMFRHSYFFSFLLPVLVQDDFCPELFHPDSFDMNFRFHRQTHPSGKIWFQGQSIGSKR
jgi:hypothetical protein